MTKREIDSACAAAIDLIEGPALGHLDTHGLGQAAAKLRGAVDLRGARVRLEAALADLEQAYRLVARAEISQRREER